MSKRQVAEDSPRAAEVVRNTAETRITIAVNLDGGGAADVGTGVPFLDHMLTLFARHSLVDLRVRAEGDVAVDYHHTVEDCGIVLGEAIKRALGAKLGIRRYGFFLLPMDETLACVALDLSNRPFLAYRVAATNVMVRDFNIILVREFFQAIANSLGANVHVRLEYGDEPHHIAEAIFKAFARALREAVSIDPREAGRLPSTKNSL